MAMLKQKSLTQYSTVDGDQRRISEPREKPKPRTAAFKTAGSAERSKCSIRLRAFANGAYLKDI